MKKLFLIVFITVLLLNFKTLAIEPDIFVQSTVNRASKLLSEELSKEKKVIIYCRTGSRSANIVNLLENSYSFQNVYNLEGGIMKWRDDIDPTIKEY